MKHNNLQNLLRDSQNSSNFLIIPTTKAIADKAIISLIGNNILRPSLSLYKVNSTINKQNEIAITISPNKSFLP